MECKARIGRTIKSKESGHWVFNDPPPPEFDKPYEGVVGILRLPFVDAQKICRVGIYACSWVKQQPILQLGDRTVCYIVISLDDDLAQRSEGQDFNAVLRHEIGHCNGWPADHSNRQARWEWVKK